MKKYIYILLIIIFCSLSSSSPSIVLQKNNYQPYETIIGEIGNITSNVSVNDIKIYEGRREISDFEKGVFNFNNTAYFYAIITKEGEFSLNISRILYTENNSLKEIALSKIINLKINDNPKIINIRPGVYKGDSPELFITNFGNSTLDIKYDKESYSINPGEYKKIKPELIYGFSYYNINSYQKFSIPIFYTLNNTLENETIDDSDNNVTKIENVSITDEIKLEILKESVYPVYIGDKSNVTFYIKNTGNSSLYNLTINSSNFSVYPNEIEFIEPNESIEINLSVSLDISNLYIEEINIYHDNEIINNDSLHIITVETEDELEQIENSKDDTYLVTCSSLGGELEILDKTECSSPDGDECSHGDCWVYNIGESNRCCLTGVKNISDKSSKKSASDIVIGILILLVVAGIGYLFYKKSNIKKSDNVKDIFKKADKK